MAGHRGRRGVVVAVAALAALAPAGAFAGTGTGDDGAKGPAPAVAVFSGTMQSLATARGVNAVDTTADDTQVGTSVAVTPAGQVAIAFGDEGAPGNHSTGIATSSNNGLTFTDRGSLPDTAAGEAGQARLAHSRSSGRTYAVVAGGALPEELQVFASTDAGATWSAPSNAAPQLGDGNVESDPSITVDDAAGTGQGNVYVCWSHTNTSVGGQQVYFGRSTDAGATFTPGAGLTIASTGFPGGCQVVVGPDHVVHVFYLRDVSRPTDPEVDLRLVARRSTDRGLTFGTEVAVASLVNPTFDPDGAIEVPNHVVANSFPRVAVSPTGLLVVTYNDVNTVGRVRAMYVRSIDAGTTWTAPAVASSETTGQQYQPTVAFSADGATAMFGYYSSATSVTGPTVHRQGRLARVVNGKTLSLLPSFQLGPETPSAASLGTFAVERTGLDEIAGAGTSFHSTWSDARTGNPFHARQLDVQYARVPAQPALTNVSLNFVNNVTTAQGEPFTAALKAVSLGGNTATDVWVRLTMPTGLVAQSVVASGAGRCYREGRVLGCYFATLGGASRTVTVTGIATAKGTQRITAAVTTSSRDDNPSDSATNLDVAVGTGNVQTATVSTAGPLALADRGEVRVPIDVEADGTVLSASARVRLDHSYDGDLDMFLVSPEGTVVELSSDNGTGGDNYGSGPNDCSGTPTEFRDTAPTSVVAGAAPFAGPFRPEAPLSAVVGQDLQGRWELVVADDASDDTGTLGCVTLAIAYN